MTEPTRTESDAPIEAVLPYASGEFRVRFDAWLDDALTRHTHALEFREIRQGVRALSSLWLERRAGGELARRAIEASGGTLSFSSRPGHGTAAAVTLQASTRPTEPNADRP